MLVVGVDQGAPRALGGEQGRLGREVVLDVGVEVEVVTAQVEEDGEVEDDPVHAPEHQGVAGDLHGAVGDAPLAHQREQGVQVGRLGRGERGGHVDPVDAGADGAHDPGVAPGGLQRRLEQPGGGGLALGPGHTDQAQRGGGVAVQPGGEPAEEPARVRGHQQRKVGRQRLGQVGGGAGTGGVGEHGDGAGGQRVGRPGDAVRAGAGQRGVQVTGQGAQRAERQPGHRPVGPVGQPGGRVERAAELGDPGRDLGGGAGRDPRGAGPGGCGRGHRVRLSSRGPHSVATSSGFDPVGGMP